jgi:hypothetical protein
MHDSGDRYIRGNPLPSGNGYGYDFLSVMDNGYRFGYVVKVTYMDIHSHYPRIIYPLPYLVLDMLLEYLQ